jgi:hypothetical protein
LLTLLVILPIGAITDTIADRLNNGITRAKPGIAIVAWKLELGTNWWEGSNGFAFPLIEEPITGTAYIPARVFQ